MTGQIVKWPFQFVVDERRAATGWAVVHSRVVTPERQEQLAVLRKARFRFLGMTSDVTFPRVDEHDPLDYGALCEAWCHCFRDPDQYLPPGQPRALLSASDFTDFHRTAPAALRPPPRSRRFDFVYVGATEPWKREAKNWELARRCIPLICRQLGARALLVASDAIDDCPGATVAAWLPRRHFLAILAGARFLFVPNRQDASPRVLAEALCLDVPLVVHREILGGWKYVNPFTGVFFDGAHDVVAAVEACLRKPRSPRDWFRANHGPYNAGRRLLELVRSVDPSVTERSYLILDDRVDGALR